MNILIYIEPHPVRCSQLSFFGVAKFFEYIAISPETNAKDNIKLLMNQKTAEALIRRTPEAAKNIIELPEKFQQFIDKQPTDSWTKEDIDRWITLLSSAAGYANTYVELLQEINRDFQMDAIVYWGANGAVREFSKKTGIPAIAMELGCSRPPHLDSIVFDPIGVNGDSIHSKISIENIKEIVNKNCFRNGPTLLHDIVHTPCADEQTLLSELATRKQQYSGTTLICLQLHDDVNLIRFAKYNSMLEFIKEIIPTLKEKNRLVIIKEHPLAYQRIGGKKLSHEMQQYLESFSNIVFIGHDKPANNLKLIALADEVITINSSFGYEAALHKKTVIIMGEACYKAAGIFPTFEEYFTKGNFNHEQYLENISYLQKYFTNLVLHSKTFAFKPSYFCQTVSAIVNAWSAAKGDTLEYCKQLATVQVIPEITYWDALRQPAPIKIYIKTSLHEYTKNLVKSTWPWFFRCLQVTKNKLLGRPNIIED